MIRAVREDTAPIVGVIIVFEVVVNLVSRCMDVGECFGVFLMSSVFLN